MIEVDVVAGGIEHVESERLSDDESNCLRLQFARIARLRTIVTVVEQLVGLCDDTHKRTYVLSTVM